MDSIKVVATLFPFALALGINLYATVFVEGIFIRMGWVQNVPEALHILAPPPILVVLRVMFLLEFFPDKQQKLGQWHL